MTGELRHVQSGTVKVPTPATVTVVGMPSARVSQTVFWKHSTLKAWSELYVTVVSPGCRRM
eukprot:scaffold7203_cov416-Prasinococcus_capsulatus_cf.AAC.18